jgi:hypothetical protein
VVRARSHTVPATDAARINLADDSAFFVLGSSNYRADGNTGGVTALHAGSGQVGNFPVREFLTVVEFINKHPGEGLKLVRPFLHGSYVIFSLAGYHTSAATGTLVDINHHGPFSIKFHLLHNVNPLTLI